MSGACASMVDDGMVRGVLATVDCQTKVYAQGGYLALTQGSGVFQAALTSLLTIYVAWVGYRMLFAQGNARLSELPMIGLKIGVILVLVTSWSTFQALVFDLADRAPVEIAALVSAPLTAEGRSSLAANPIDGLQAVYNEMSDTSNAFGKLAGAGPGAEVKAYSSPQAAAAEATSTASGAIFLAGPAVIAAATLAIGILTAVGPVFIALALIPATRGLFVGWVRALAAAAFTPLVGWLLVVLMLSVLEPWLNALATQRKTLQLDPQTAMSASALVFVFAFGQAALVVGACVMAMGFRLPRLGGAVDGARDGAGAPPRPEAASGPQSPMPSRAERLVMDLQRDQAQASERSRAAAAAAAARATTTRQVSVTIDENRRLGDAYRRPAFAARRAGAAR